MDYLDDKRLLATEPKHELTVLDAKLAAIPRIGGKAV
jgi:hypothetical protein